MAVPNRFIARATGGVAFYTDVGPTMGVSLAGGESAWAPVSDRNLKENFADVQGEELLQRLNGMPMQTWNYISQDDSIRHMGPMAQDFHAAFGLGTSDTRITTIDADGVALTGVQALYRRSLETEQENEELRKEVRELRAIVEALQQRLGVEVSQQR